jgi:prolipoprotein diacylglyceryltransferase
MFVMAPPISPLRLHPANAFLDRIIKPVFIVRGKVLPAWHVFAGSGVAAGSGLFLWAARHAGLAWLPVAMLMAANAAAFWVHDRLNRRFGRPARLILIRHLAVNFAVTFAVSKAAGLPVLAVLDAWSAGMALLLAFGRLGCLTVGCCHGRPAGFGAKYFWRPVRNRANFDPEMRFLPVQAGEFLLLLPLCGFGIAILRIPHRPGDVTALFLAGYGVVRFGLETMRGDQRHYFGRLSEAQWCSMALAGAALGLAWAAQPQRAAIWLPATVTVSFCFAAEAAAAIISGTLRKPTPLSGATPRDRR